MDQAATSSIARKVGIGVLAAVLNASAGAGLAYAEETLTAVSAFPSTLVWGESFLDFVDLVNQRGKGIVQIDYRGGPEVFPGNQQIDALRRGVVDMQYGPATYYLSTLPEADAWVGSTVSAPEARANGGFAIMQEAFSKRLGVTLLGHFGSAVKFYIYTVDEPKLTEDGGVDLDGMRLRAVPLYYSFYEALGAIPITVPVPDVYTGLERHSFDGLGFPLIGVRDLSWDKYLRYRIDPGYLGTDVALVVNSAKWGSLSDEAKEVLTTAAVEYEQTSVDRLQALIGATDQAVRDAGMTVISLEGEAQAKYLDLAYDSVWKRMKDAGSEYYDALRGAYYQR